VTLSDVRMIRNERLENCSVLGIGIYFLSHISGSYGCGYDDMKMIETVYLRTSETSFCSYEATRHHVPEGYLSYSTNFPLDPRAKQHIVARFFKVIVNVRYL
jgi:hypothetical protein